MTAFVERRQFIKGLAGAAGVGIVTKLKLNAAYAAAEVDCPIYMFHETSAAGVESLLAANLRTGRIPITIKDLTAVVRGEKPVPEKPLFALTFDDMLRSQLAAARVLKLYEAPATFNVMSDLWQGDGAHQYMNWNEVLDLYRSGFEIASHTHNHDPNLIALRSRNYNSYLAEVVGSKQRIEELIDDEVVTFCSPASVYDGQLIQDVISAGYLGALSTGPNQKAVNSYRRQGSLYQLDRQAVT